MKTMLAMFDVLDTAASGRHFREDNMRHPDDMPEEPTEAERAAEADADNDEQWLLERARLDVFIELRNTLQRLANSYGEEHERDRIRALALLRRTLDLL